MYCPACRKTMLSTSSQEMQDEQGAMTITRWRCHPCGETAEEIWMSTGYRGPGSSSICGEADEQDRAAFPFQSKGGSRRGTLAQAALC